MAWNNANEIPVGSDGQVYVADLGTAMPTAHDSALAPATWGGVGFLTEDGFGFNSGLDIAEIVAWQAQNAVRREVQKREMSFNFSMMQWNEQSLLLAFGGGSIASAGTGWKYTPPADSDAIKEFALVIEAKDGSNVYRFCAPRVTVTESVEGGMKRGEAAILPVTAKALEPASGGDAWFLLTNQAGLATGS